VWYKAIDAVNSICVALREAGMLDDEAARLRALYRYAVLDTEPEPNFDRITLLASRIFGLPICTMSLADADRHWFKSHHGVDATEIPRRLSFCDETLRSRNGLVVPDARADPRFADAPIVAGSPGLRFYAGHPLTTPDGQRIGSLCVLDVQPHHDFDPSKLDILANLAGTSIELLEARSRNIQLARCTEELVHLAGHDSLTGLANRRFLQKQLEDAVAEAGPDDQAALLYIDLDHFKGVNDSLGHGAGDEVLKEVARRLRACVRRQDHVARLGGDEFVVLLSGHHARPTAVELGERVLEAIRAPYPLRDRTIEIGASIGVTFVPQLAGWPANLDDMLKNADVALYDAKCAGRGRIGCFEPVA
jgi:diguanylate cyclase (GGDEF)-like protein